MQEFQAAGICSEGTVTIVAGPDEYLFGEEKAMLEVIEGKPPLPRWFPPYEHGLFATDPQLGWEATPRSGPRDGPNPTLVNNVETLSNVPHILARGPAWFRAMGTAESPGTIVATVVGDVVAPDVGEVELGTPLRAVIDAVGSGVAPGRHVKAVFSGVANPVVTAANLDTPLSYEGFTAIGSGMGAAGLIVYDDTACMVDVAYQLSRFLYIVDPDHAPIPHDGGEQAVRMAELAGEVGGPSQPTSAPRRSAGALSACPSERRMPSVMRGPAPSGRGRRAPCEASRRPRRKPCPSSPRRPRPPPSEHRARVADVEAGGVVLGDLAGGTVGVTAPSSCSAIRQCSLIRRVCDRSSSTV